MQGSEFVDVSRPQPSSPASRYLSNNSLIPSFDELGPNFGFMDDNVRADERQWNLNSLDPVHHMMDLMLGINEQSSGFAGGADMHDHSSNYGSGGVHGLFGAANQADDPKSNSDGQCSVAYSAATYPGDADLRHCSAGKLNPSSAPPLHYRPAHAHAAPHPLDTANASSDSGPQTNSLGSSGSHAFKSQSSADGTKTGRDGGPEQEQSPSCRRYFHNITLKAPLKNFCRARMKLCMRYSLQKLPQLSATLDGFAAAAVGANHAEAAAGGSAALTRAPESLDINLAEWGLCAVTIPANSNCFLHALLVTTGTSDRYGSVQQLRDALVDELVKIQDIPFNHTGSSTLRSNLESALSWESYLAEMRRDGVACDHNMVFAASLLFQRKIVVVSSLTNAPPVVVAPSKNDPVWHALRADPMEMHAPIVLGHVYGMRRYAGTEMCGQSSAAAAAQRDGLFGISGTDFNANSPWLGGMTGDRFNAYAAAHALRDDLEAEKYRTFRPTTMDTPEKYWLPSWNCPHPRLVGTEYKSLPFKSKSDKIMLPPYRTHETDKIRGQRLYATCACLNRQSPYQIYLNKEFPNTHFNPRMTPKRKEALGALLKWCMRYSGFLKDRKKRNTLSKRKAGKHATRKATGASKSAPNALVSESTPGAPEPAAASAKPSHSSDVAAAAKPLPSSSAATTATSSSASSAPRLRAVAVSASVAAEFNPSCICSIKETLTEFGVPWQRFVEWAKHEDHWPKKFLSSLSGQPFPTDDRERRKLGPSLREAGLKVLEQAITEFFTVTPGNNGDRGSVVLNDSGESGNSGASPQRSHSQDHLRKMTAYIAAEYAKFIADKGSKGKEETYQEHLEHNDPMEGLSSMDDRASRSKFFVLVFGLIETANMRRLFGELQEADDRLDIAQALLNYNDNSNNKHLNTSTVVASDASDGLGARVEAEVRSGCAKSPLPKSLAKRVESFEEEESRLDDGDRSNLQLRINIVRAQVVRRLKKKLGWRNSRLAFLLQRIKHEAKAQGYDVVNRFARFQELMCRLNVAYSRVHPKAPVVSSSSNNCSGSAPDATSESATSAAVSVQSVSARDEVMLVIRELKFLKREYDAALKSASETGDAKKESFVWLHRQYVKAELMNWEHVKLKSINSAEAMKPEDALQEWEIMLKERRTHLSDGHRHSVYAIRQVVRLRIKLGVRLEAAKELLQIAMEHQQDEKWRQDKLVPLMKELDAKLGCGSRGDSRGGGGDLGSHARSKRKHSSDDSAGRSHKRR